MSGWTVRRAGPEDADALALVGAASFLDGFADILPGADIVAHCAARNSPQAYRTWLAAGPALWLGETATGAPVGYAGLSQPDLPQARAGDVELKRIYALSRFHGSGLGRALMETAVGEARALGAQRLLLGVYPGNHRAIAFYRRTGFAVIGARAFTVGATTIPDDLVFALEL